MIHGLAPTGHCFDDALEYLEELARTGAPDFLEHRLVHGFVEVADGRASHAWVEHGDDAIVSGLMCGMRFYVEVPRAKFYADLRVHDVTRYTPAEAWEENRRYKTYGPWQQKYFEHCRNYAPGMSIEPKGANP